MDDQPKTLTVPEYTAKVGDKRVPQVPGSGAIRDAIAQLGGIARFQGEEATPAFRVGGTREEIWIDLGDEDWRTVRVTVQGWRVMENPDVAFVRTGSMLALPEPVRGGNIRALKRVLNVQASDFVLVVGWLLQALNPIGPYPFSFFNSWYAAANPITAPFFFESETAGLTFVRHRLPQRCHW